MFFPHPHSAEADICKRFDAGVYQHQQREDKQQRKKD
jgi:hypothetical protein